MNQQELASVRPMLEELIAHRARLGSCGGGLALQVCLEAIELMEDRVYVVDYGGRRRVLAAVAELLELTLPGPGVSEGGEAYREWLRASGLDCQVWGDPISGA